MRRHNRRSSDCVKHQARRLDPSAKCPICKPRGVVRQKVTLVVDGVYLGEVIRTVRRRGLS